MIESFRKRRWSIPALALVILVGSAIVIGVSNRAAEPNGAAPAGALGGFLSQTDGKFGYEMLRPAGWTSHDGSFARFYSDIPDGTRARLLLIVYNPGARGACKSGSQWDRPRVGLLPTEPDPGRLDQRSGTELAPRPDALRAP
jgi:hypothetical protein